jgi:hypothetical protein
MEAQVPELARRWKLYSGKGAWYEDDLQGGMFIPDATFSVCGEPVLYVEVAFTQSLADVRAKVGRILHDVPDSILGILVLDIAEVPKWSSPKTASVAADFVSQQDWRRLVAESRVVRPFGRIVINGHVWMENVRVNLCFFDRTWSIRDKNPPLVCSSGQTITIIANSITVPPAGSWRTRFTGTRCNVDGALGNYRQCSSWR